MTDTGRAPVRVGIVGASGITGGELLRLLLPHPQVEVTYLGGANSAGGTVVELHPGLRSAGRMQVEAVDPGEIGRRCDVVLLATPAPVSAHLASALAAHTRIIDLSGAFRIADPATHDHWYPTARRDQALAGKFVYGVPELIAGQLRSAEFISIPGCFATAVTLGLAPIVDGQQTIPIERILVDGKTGSSGGGISLDRAGAHPFRNGAISPYAPEGHRHAAEVRDFFVRAAGFETPMSMSAYGVSNVRGLLASCYVFPASGADTGNLFARYVKYYRGEPFVRIRRHDETAVPVPDPHVLVGSNYCDITVIRDVDGERIVVLAALDNIVKGAAGQAVQALNISMGLPQTTGLTHDPVVPV